MIFKSLDKVDSSIYKGIAILMIVIHNFMHSFPTPKEMEFQFYPDRFGIFLQSFNESSNIVQILFSFLGHYGVQIFIFLSAYGLTKRYQRAQEIEIVSYIQNRIRVIYPSFILALVLYILVSANWSFGILSPIKHVYWNFEVFFNKLFMLSNFLPGQELSLSGPWWFISFIFQFYLVFPWLLKAYDRWKGQALLLLSLLSLSFNAFYQPETGEINVYFTVLGHLPEFCLGIYIARNDSNSLNISNLFLILALGIFLLGNQFKLFWSLSHISFLIVLLFTFNLLRNAVLNHLSIKRFFTFFGSISMPLFLVNGFLREPFLTYAKDYDHWLFTLLFCLISLSVSIVVAMLLAKTETKIMKKMSNLHGKQQIT